MADRIVTFFGRQMISGSQTGSAFVFSGILDITGTKTLILEWTVWTVDPLSASYTANLQVTDDRRFSSWSTESSEALVGPGRKKILVSDPERFTRVVLMIPANSKAMISYYGIARS